ncbi:MAG TPA: phosphoglycerate mutase family protein [Pseudonocardia sp.]|nr:phosphoglycerate mutase family protein [Pseudonocardia sp.]
MNARLTLVAHASTAATARALFSRDEGLEPRGAAAAAAASAPRRITRAVCSPARAAVETATALGLAATVDARLADWHLGEWRGRALDDVAAAHPAEVAAWLADPDAVPHGGESLTALLARVAGWLAGVDLTAGPEASARARGSGRGAASAAARGSGGSAGGAGSTGACVSGGSAAGAGPAGGAAVGHTVAVTHAAVVRAAVVVTLGAPPAGFWRIDVAPLTATVLRGGPGRWTVRGTALPLDPSPGGR